ncbi:MAG: tetratricopeptide repeat protein [Spirochaetaceae bacterium]|jgi:putative GTP pyrophosphokinase|nr:tetratricopeptide repeat protein [Spirochaetaceae bacterium]
MEQIKPDRKALLDEYETYYSARRASVYVLEQLIENALEDMPSRPLVKGRVKAFPSFYKKYLKLLKLDNTTVPFITDLIGIRIICPFLEDLHITEHELKKHFEVTETDFKSSGSYKEFGYQSTHLLVRIPQEIRDTHSDLGLDFAEIQITTILQNAWAEVEHELVYKAEFTPFDPPMRRKLAAVNATLTLADTIFQEIRAYQRELHGQLDKRRETFFKQIEEETDSKIDVNNNSLLDEKFAEESSKNLQTTELENGTIDSLLLNALYAHNRKDFATAIGFYSKILTLKPNEKTASIIYKHRGMAYFAEGRYEEAVSDFSYSYENDQSAYKALYYRGVVKSVLSKYTEAADDFTASLALNPYQPYCLYRRAQAYYHLEDYTAALADTESSIALDGSNNSILQFKQVLLNKLEM